MSKSYRKAKLVRLRSMFDEKWLQNKIEEDPSILGLGDVNVIARERKQSSGGRLDFLLHDPESDTMYEVEVMLGKTDESHIIRTVEYWDLERKRYPNKEHRAVIVAEDITNRFFNVISLMNRSIPIIAIQVNTFVVENFVSLVFTKVLDIYEPPEDETDIGGESVDKHYWESRSNAKSLSIVDQVYETLLQKDNSIRLTYNKHHIAIGTQKRNIIWLHPRKKEGYCYIDLKVGRENIDDVKAKLEEVGVSFTVKKDDIVGIALQSSELRKGRDAIMDIFYLATEAYS